MLLYAIYSVSDILELTSPLVIIAKLLNSQINLRFGWDEILPEDIIKR